MLVEKALGLQEPHFSSKEAGFKEASQAIFGGLEPLL